MSETPKPSDLSMAMKKAADAAKVASAGMAVAGEAARKTGEEFVQNLKALNEAKKAAHRPRAPHLTQRPFHTEGLITMRDAMQRNVKIKKK